jgi:Fe-S oxidoreductase
MGGVAQERAMPKFAAKTFRRLTKKRSKATPGKPKVILWVDTFCEHFHPEVATAAVEVLSHAGFDAVLPETPLCCGRPLYDFGYIDQAKEKLRRILDVVDQQMATGHGAPIAVVGLEPGCMSVFKDELLKLFPDDPRAKRLSANVWLLGDFLYQHDYQPPRYEVDVLVHAHCHQKSLFGTKGDTALLERMGARATYLDSGCCGMAGSFGFNPEHIGISKAVGELVLLPAVRSQSADTVILTNGFSCREQIRQGSGREVMHLAELLQLAHRRGQSHAAPAAAAPVTLTLVSPPS